MFSFLQIVLYLWHAVGLAWINADNCGMRDEAADTRRSLITNGHVAEPYSFPWQVALWKDSEHFCGGSILNEFWILTAAHCVVGRNGKVLSPDKYYIIAGDYHILESDTDARQNISISAIIINPNYVEHHNETKEYDIAVLKLDRPLNLSTSSPWKVTPICLPNSSQEAPYGEPLLISGWGKKDDYSAGTEVEMHWNEVILRNDDYCLALGGSIFYNPDDQICFDKSYNTDYQNGIYFDTGRGDCRGDSGGPSVHQQADGRFYQEGVCNKGLFCGNLLSIGIHAEVRAHMDWISSTIFQWNISESLEEEEYYDLGQDERCETQSEFLDQCLHNYVALRCPVGDEYLPACLWENQEWMLTCDSPAHHEEASCNHADFLSYCGEDVLIYIPTAVTNASDANCETANGTYEMNCFTCYEGYEIEPLYEDCTGICVPVGTAMRVVECTPPEQISCILEYGYDMIKSETLVKNCSSRNQTNNHFAYLYCGDSDYPCRHPVNESDCAEDFAMCKLDEEHWCLPIDGIGSPRICEQCILNGEAYIFGECASFSTLVSYMYPYTALASFTKDDCPRARQAVIQQLNCVKQRSCRLCVMNPFCQWSDTAQLCFFETHHPLHDASTICPVVTIPGFFNKFNKRDMYICFITDVSKEVALNF